MIKIRKAFSGYWFAYCQTCWDFITQADTHTAVMATVCHHQHTR